MAGVRTRWGGGVREHVNPGHLFLSGDSLSRLPRLGCAGGPRMNVESKKAEAKSTDRSVWPPVVISRKLQPIMLCARRKAAVAKVLRTEGRSAGL